MAVGHAIGCGRAMETDSRDRASDAAYQGAPGAYSEDAAFVLAGREASLLPCDSLADVFQAVAGGRARTAVVPIENTLAGTVPDAYELLLASDLEARGETLVRIDHVLAAAPGVRLGEIRRALSHPVALAQCHRFFRANRDIAPVPVFDTAGAVALAMRDQGGDTAAVASRRAAALHGAAIVAEDIQDHRENWTRFLLLAPPATPRTASSAPASKAIVTFRVAHEPGSLVRVLDPMSRRKLNLTKIESRPIHGQPFEYVFIVDVVADRTVEDLLAALEEVRPTTRSMRVLGAFPRPASQEANLMNP